MEICIASPSVKVVRHEELQTSKSLPVFNGNDRVGGQVILDPICNQSGRLSIAVRTTTSFFACKESLIEMTSDRRRISVYIPQNRSTGRAIHRKLGQGPTCFFLFDLCHPSWLIFRRYYSPHPGIYPGCLLHTYSEKTKCFKCSQCEG